LRLKHSLIVKNFFLQGGSRRYKRQDKKIVFLKKIKEFVTYYHVAYEKVKGVMLSEKKTRILQKLVIYKSGSVGRKNFIRRKKA
jgi:hypothetical protein